MYTLAIILVVVGAAACGGAEDNKAAQSDSLTAGCEKAFEVQCATQFGLGATIGECSDFMAELQSDSEAAGCAAEFQAEVSCLQTSRYECEGDVIGPVDCAKQDGALEDCISSSRPDDPPPDLVDY